MYIQVFWRPLSFVNLTLLSIQYVTCTWVTPPSRKNIHGSSILYTTLTISYVSENFPQSQFHMINFFICRIWFYRLRCIDEVELGIKVLGEIILTTLAIRARGVRKFSNVISLKFSNPWKNLLSIWHLVLSTTVSFES